MLEMPFGRWDKKREATIEARLEAVELTLLAVLPELSPESQAVVRSQMAHFVERAVAHGPPVVARSTAIRPTLSRDAERPNAAYDSRNGSRGVTGAADCGQYRQAGGTVT